MIADLLNVARIESNTFSINKTQVDLHACSPRRASNSPQALACNIALACETSAEVAAVSADRDRLSQALGNLVGNALKFTPAGGRVSLRAAGEEGAVRISVEDTGIGIPPQSLPHIFDRFWQAARSSRAGPGLGLAICKGIVEAHGDRIWAGSTEGSGTTTSPCPRQKTDLCVPTGNPGLYIPAPKAYLRGGPCPQPGSVRSRDSFVG